MQKIVSAILFIVCFAIGATAMFGSVLCDEMVGFYRTRQLLNREREYSAQLESLIADYEALLEKLKDDPNLVSRLGAAKLGSEGGKEPNTAYPEVNAEQLAAARKSLTEDSEQGKAEPSIPQWLSRCSQPGRQTILFLAGGILILISLVCFRPSKKTAEQHDRDIN